jgi:RNA polymerase sigma factor (sigma-70 family)
MDLSDHLFRRESGRMVAAVTRIFGFQNLQLAEDVVQEAFYRALEVWKFRSIPENPSAWLLMTAKNCALDAMRRERTARTFAPEVSRFMQSEWTLAPVVNEMFGANVIKDDLLRMMFSCCQPALAEESQVALILNILCGFSVDEIAAAFVSSHAAIEKRITRSKSLLAKSKNLFDIADGSQFAARLPAVHRALYLLFSEGYHGACPEATIRAELCREAMRLAALLPEHPQGATPTTHALAALMCLDAARLPSRVDGEGNLRPLSDQNRLLWDSQLIAEGFKFLELSAKGRELTEYHVEAAIASVHARAPTLAETDWSAIVALYDSLMTIRPTPIVALNRAIAIAQAQGPGRGLEEMATIADSERLAKYPFYFAAMGELEFQLASPETARKHFLAALALARNPMERAFFERRIGACVSSVSQQ